MTHHKPLPANELESEARVILWLAACMGIAVGSGFIAWLLAVLR